MFVFLKHKISSIMKATFIFSLCLSFAFCSSQAQKISSTNVPLKAKEAFSKMYPSVKTIIWEKEDGNFEGNWKENGMDHSAAFTPNGNFAASETDILPSALPEKVKQYVNEHYHTKISEASVNLDANRALNYEADIKGGRAILFDKSGNFIKETKGD